MHSALTVPLYYVTIYLQLIVCAPSAETRSRVRRAWDRGDTRIAYVVKVVRKYRWNGLRCLREQSAQIGAFYIKAHWPEKMLALCCQRMTLACWAEK